MGQNLYTAPFYSLATALNYMYSVAHGYDFRYYILRYQPTSEPERRAADRPASLFQKAAFQIDVVYSLLEIAVGNSSWTVAGKLHGLLGELYKRYRQLFSSRVFSRQPAIPTSGKAADSPACEHPQFGPRAASWGKLLCIADALRDYQQVVYIDTDAFFSSPQVTVAQFLSRNKVDSASLVLTDNFPWNEARSANAGFMIWNNGPDAGPLLSDWWNFDGGERNLGHDWEQFALHEGILPSEHADRIAIIEERTFLEKNGQFCRHIPGPFGLLRLPRLRAAAVAAGLTAELYREVMEKIRANHVIEFCTQGLTV